MRIALAKLLLGRPSLLLLDEPTNHLDLEARNWLETYLHEYPHAVILVSHDRFFLDAVVTRIADLTLRTLTDYIGNYSDYLVAHEARSTRCARPSASRTKKSRASGCSSIASAIRRPRLRRCRAASRCSRRSSRSRCRRNARRSTSTFRRAPRAVEPCSTSRAWRKTYGDLMVFTRVDLHIERGDRIALVGPNGSGKSTLMRMLSGEETPGHGPAHRRPQRRHGVLRTGRGHETRSGANGLRNAGERIAAAHGARIRNILGGFLFSGDDVDKPVRVLSGGERTRLAVARMLLRPSNTLLLDEPTNHLDLDSKEVLLDALVDYGGTLIFVSHDRYFVERLATKIIEIGGGHALVYPGTYKEFLWHKDHSAGGRAGTGRMRRARQEPATRAGARSGQTGAARARPRATTATRRGPPRRRQNAPQPSRDEKKRADAEARKKARAEEARRVRIEQLEARIAETEQAIKDIEGAMAVPGFYDDRAAAQTTIDRHQALMWKVGDLMHQWEELQAAASLSSSPDV